MPLPPNAEHLETTRIGGDRAVVFFNHFPLVIFGALDFSAPPTRGNILATPDDKPYRGLPSATAPQSPSENGNQDQEEFCRSTIDTHGEALKDSYLHHQSHPTSVHFAHLHIPKSANDEIDDDGALALLAIWQS